jgi:hypothetical protein
VAYASVIVAVPAVPASTLLRGQAIATPFHQREEGPQPRHPDRAIAVGRAPSPPTSCVGRTRRVICVQAGDLEAIRELAREGARLLVVPRLEIGRRDLDVRIARASCSTRATRSSAAS